MRRPPYLFSPSRQSADRKIARETRGPLSAVALFALASLTATAAADPITRVAEVLFAPQGLPARDHREARGPQIAVWIEKPDGKWVADLYVTRSVGLLGIGNRPGQALLKSDFRWPYGRRPMALPIWAHRRGKQYGYVVMGGKCSTRYNPQNPSDTTCPNDFQGSPSDDDTTVAYHNPVSSTESYFCSPSGHRTTKQNGVDVVTCASSFFGSKGWYAPGMHSPYPPRADLKMFGANDHPDAQRFAQDNDVAAVSGATPPAGLLAEPIRWYVAGDIPDGSYVAWIEVNIESDFNAFWQPGKAVPEPHSEWNYLGYDFLGQPSIVYQVPFLLDRSGHRIATVSDYAGYGDWRGQSGVVNPPDSSISASGGSGADRLKLISDESGSWRVKVSIGPCDAQTCGTPAPPAELDLSEVGDASVTVKFAVPAGPPASAYEVRYLAGMPITAENFMSALPATPTNLGPPGTIVSTHILGLSPKTKYYVAVRPKNCCGHAGDIVTGAAETAAAQFVTLSGCFIATAAYGSELAGEVATLRRFRDERLLKNPLGQAAVASYYALSPGLSAVLADSEPLRALARAALGPVARAARAAVSAP